MEISGVDHQLLVFLVLFSEISLGDFQPDILLFDAFFQESNLFLVYVHQVILGHLQLMVMLFLQLGNLTIDLLFVSCH